MTWTEEESIKYLREGGLPYWAKRTPEGEWIDPRHGIIFQPDCPSGAYTLTVSLSEMTAKEEITYYRLSHAAATSSSHLRFRPDLLRRVGYVHTEGLFTANRRRGKIHDPDRIAAAMKMIIKGFSLENVEERTGIPHRTLWNWITGREIPKILSKLNDQEKKKLLKLIREASERYFSRPVNRNRKPHSRETIKKALEMLADGQTLKGVSEEMGLHPSLLWHWVYVKLPSTVRGDLEISELREKAFIALSRRRNRKRSFNEKLLREALMIIIKGGTIEEASEKTGIKKKALSGWIERETEPKFLRLKDVPEEKKEEIRELLEMVREVYRQRSEKREKMDRKKLSV